MRFRSTLVCSILPFLALAGPTTHTHAFEENKGQVRTTSGDPAPFVRYRLNQGDADIFLLNNGIAYQFSRTHYPEGYTALARTATHDATELRELDALRKDIRTETYRMDMLLEGANPAPRISTTGRSSDYTHYYNRDVLDVHTYTTVTYHDVWPGIDWVVYTKESGMKYDFIVHPGADPVQVQLRFSDHEELYVDAKGDLVHGNRMGRFTEAKPVSFQEGKAIATRFVLEGDLLRFAVDAYDASKTLTIDPERVWGTYYGGLADEAGANVAVGGDGSVYLSGTTYSSNAIAEGGYSGYYAGEGDAFLVKFAPDGTRSWGTYFGGPGDDVGTACVVDLNGHVYLVGSTSSMERIAERGHQTTYGGDDHDAYLVKFSAEGTLLWATYYGGEQVDVGQSCSVDGDGNVYLVGSTSSNLGIASGGHQNTRAGADAFLVKFGPSGTRLWGTYYGGVGAEEGHACAVDALGSVFLVGRTGSNNGIASGGHQNLLGGPVDGFVVKFSSGGVRQWASYYGGAGNDNATSCATGADGSVYVAGMSESTGSIASGGHQNTHAGLEDAYLVKFNAGGVRQWATYYGGDSWDWANACFVDHTGDIYLSGITLSTTGIAHGGQQNGHGGGQDAFLVKFSPAGTRQWATYYGGEGDENIGRCSAGPDGSVYLSGTTVSTVGIASNGHQNIGGGSTDVFLVKFRGSGGGIGVQEHAHVAPLSIWPSPTNGPITIEHAQHVRVHGVVVYDTAGRAVAEQGVGTTAGPLFLDLSQQAPGVYVVELRFADGTRALERVVKE